MSEKLDLEALRAEVRLVRALWADTIPWARKYGRDVGDLLAEVERLRRVVDAARGIEPSDIPAPIRAALEDLEEGIGCQP